jgi:hypothetical protein
MEVNMDHNFKEKNSVGRDETYTFRVVRKPEGRLNRVLKASGSSRTF